MAWTFHTWATETNVVARLTALRSHIAEVTAKVDLEIQGDGKGKSSNVLGSYLTKLLEKEKELEDRAQRQGLAGGAGSVSQVRIVDEE
jgi:hypothetical protein